MGQIDCLILPYALCPEYHKILSHAMNRVKLLCVHENKPKWRAEKNEHGICLGWALGNEPRMHASW